MAWTNDNVPKIVYEMDDQATNTIAQIAATLDHNEFGAAGDLLRSMGAATAVNLERATNRTVNATIKEITDLMKSRQYHSKSGYIGHGNMVSQVKDHKTSKGTHEIYTDALAADGYNYSQAFEFGLLNRNYPAHHPFEDAARHLDGEFERNVDEAIKRGMR